MPSAEADPESMEDIVGIGAEHFTNGSDRIATVGHDGRAINDPPPADCIDLGHVDHPLPSLNASADGAKQVSPIHRESPCAVDCHAFVGCRVYGWMRVTASEGEASVEVGHMWSIPLRKD